VQLFNVAFKGPHKTASLLLQVTPRPKGDCLVHSALSTSHVLWLSSWSDTLVGWTFGAGRNQHQVYVTSDLNCNNFKERKSSWEGSILLAGRRIPSLLWKLQVNYPFQSNPLEVFILCHVTPVHNPHPILPSQTFSCKCSLSFIYSY